MKNFLTILLLSVGLFLVGCSNDSSLVGPTQQNIQSSSSFIALGDNLSLQKSDPLYIVKTVNGNTGGQIDIVGSFDKGKIEVNGTLTVPAGAYSGDLDITILMEGKEAVIDFGPSSITFETPLLFTMEVVGVKIKKKDQGQIHFVYLDGNGTLTPVELLGTTVVNSKDRMLSVYDAPITHFSRYGWAK
ncbi:MAG: hypothetical protein COW08_09680 [Ignavibacteriales bacterium CG12_big_fil_rev_8_21_14_0_65_30_8]|nr:MAG: hypothetical protein COW08_09680 [Ignavibacteriales bacterium CG12_big_fil_rev_8_21_14_0_65_30_8]